MEEHVQNSELAELTTKSMTLIQHLETNSEGSISATYGDPAKCILMLWGVKIGAVIGGRIDHGYLLTKLTHSQSGLEGLYRWSAPLFVHVKVLQAGLDFGFARSRSFMFDMTGQLIKEFSKGGSHSLVGVDHSFSMCAPSAETKSDVIALSWGGADLAGNSVVTGAIMDFSFALGSMRVDESKIRRVYGPNTTALNVINGLVPSPPEMAPLYAYINSMISDNRPSSASPSLTRASLQRYTAGYDPDRRMVTSTSARVIHRGDSVEDTIGRVGGDVGSGSSGGGGGSCSGGGGAQMVVPKPREEEVAVERAPT